MSSSDTSRARPRCFVTSSSSLRFLAGQAREGQQCIGGGWETQAAGALPPAPAGASYKRIQVLMGPGGSPPPPPPTHPTAATVARTPLLLLLLGSHRQDAFFH